MSEVRPSLPDPVEIHDRLWHGFRGAIGWDVGANCGQTILDMAFEFGHIEAFEPCLESYLAAGRLIGLHRMPARVHYMAMSDHDGSVTLAYPGAEQRETGQLVTIGLAGMEWEPPDWDATQKVIVACSRADAVAAELGMPDFIKVDTEGHEVPVLQGASEILARRKTDFLIEFHSPDNHQACQEILEAFGYPVEVVRHPHYREGSPMWLQHGWLRARWPRP